MSPQMTEASASSPEAPRVLVVEDESIISLDIRTKLSLLGYNPVGAATTGEEAIAKARELRPDLVLMDVRLRGAMDGIAAAGRIQSELDVPVVYITAFGDEDTMARAKATNPYGYLIKPFQEKDLRTTVDIALYRYQMERALRDAQGQLEAHGQRQAAMAELGLKALSGADVPELFQEASALVAKTLKAEGATVLEVLADGKGFLLRAAVGWSPELVGKVTIGVGQESMTEYTLAVGEPVVSLDLSQETRFKPWPTALREGFVSAATVVIQGRGHPYGILGASSKKARAFTTEEVHYLQAVANVLAMAIDRKRDDERLRQQATILANVRDSIIVANADGRIVYWNAGASAIFGYSVDEMVGQPIAHLSSPGAEEAWQRQWQELLSVDEVAGERTQVRKDGELITVDFRAAMVRDGQAKPVGIITVMRDITERKQMEETIRQLSTPTLQVGEGMLLIPLVGMMDPKRAEQLTGQALQAIRTKRARVIVIDLTGVAAMDDAAAQHLAQTASAARMLGATVIFTGITAPIAGTLVDLGEYLKGMRVAGDLQSGIEEASRLLRRPTSSALNRTSPSPATRLLPPSAGQGKPLKKP